MNKCMVVFMVFSVSGVQLTRVVHEPSSLGGTVRCVFSENAALAYNPGFMAPFKVKRGFKKKLFFCASGTIARECLKKKQTCITNEYAVIFELVSVPVPGLLIMVAYDPDLIAFSWLKDVLSSAYVFYFSQKKKHMEYLQEIEAMC